MYIYMLNSIRRLQTIKERRASQRHCSYQAFCSLFCYHLKCQNWSYMPMVQNLLIFLFLLVAINIHELPSGSIKHLSVCLFICHHLSIICVHPCWYLWDDGGSISTSYVTSRVMLLWTFQTCELSDWTTVRWVAAIQSVCRFKARMGLSLHHKGWKWGRTSLALYKVVDFVQRFWI